MKTYLTNSKVARETLTSRVVEDEDTLKKEKVKSCVTILAQMRIEFKNFIDNIVEAAYEAFQNAIN